MTVGQEDLDQADLTALRSAGVRLGASTHSCWVSGPRLSAKPVLHRLQPHLRHPKQRHALGAPQGLDNLPYWAGLLNVPVVR